MIFISFCCLQKSGLFQPHESRGTWTRGHPGTQGSVCVAGHLCSPGAFQRFGVLLLAAALVSPGDSSHNNQGFVLCLCQTLAIHPLQPACFDVVSGGLDFDGLFSPEISLIE